jgi:hypothetical protein
MKFALSFIIAAFIVSASAVSQIQNGIDNTKEPLYFVKIAADITLNLQQNSLNNSLGVYIFPKDWDEAGRDSDLGPFMKLKEAGAKDGRSAACLFSSTKDSAVCVYFDGDFPFGVAAAKAAPGGSITAADVAASYKPVTKEMLKKSDQKLQFTVADVNTDGGVLLPAFAITTQ